MTPDQVVREVRILRYGPAPREIPLTVLAHTAGIGERTVYDIAETGHCSDLLAAKISAAFNLLRGGGGQVAPPDPWKAPIRSHRRSARFRRRQDAPPD
jgi:hypothetical protein